MTYKMRCGCKFKTLQKGGFKRISTSGCWQHSPKKQEQIRLALLKGY